MDVAKEVAKCNSIIKDAVSMLENINQSHLKSIDGINKLKQKTEKEISFLEKNIKNGTIKPEHVCCNPLNVSTCYWSYAKLFEECKFLLKRFYFVHNGEKSFITVDIVSHGGEQWNKIVCRNPRALTRIWRSTDEKYKRKSILNKGKRFVSCSEQNEIMFKSPRIVFHFTNGIESELAGVLQKIGILVNGKIIPADDDPFYSFAELHIDDEKKQRSLNLDVTAMIAYTSSLTTPITTDNNLQLSVGPTIIRDQAEMEKTMRVKDVLDKLFEGKQLFCCESALKKFNSIVSTVAGHSEKDRAERLLQRITVVPDDPSDRALSLSCRGKINAGLIAVFGTGDRQRMPTVTSSIGFVNAAKHQGVEFAVYMHDLRLFSEKPKEIQ